MNKYIAGLLVGVFVLPFGAFAETQEQIMEHISLLQQVVVLLQQELAILIGQQSDTGQQDQGDQQFGSAEASYSIDVSVEWGAGSWADYDTACRHEVKDPNYDCNNTFLDGTARFTIDQPYTKARLTYWKVSAPDKVYTSWGLFHNNQPAEETFDPNTSYHWEVEAVNDTGESALSSGDFTTGDYSL